MDATTPPRGDDQTSPAEPAVAQRPTGPEQPQRVGGSSAVGAASAAEPASSAPSGPPPADDGPEDPTVPDTAVEATLTTERAGSRPEEPVVPTPNADEVQVQQPTAAEGDTHLAAERQAPPAAAPDATAPAPAGAAPAAPAAAAPPVAPADDSPAPIAAPQPAAPAHDVVYVAAPTPPKKKGNRGIGALLAALSTILFFLIYVGVVVLINAVQGRGASMEFLSILEFYIPVVLFAIGFVLLAVIVNRAGWWSFVLGSFFVGAFVYLGYVTLLLLSEASTLTPDAALVSFRSLLISPITVAAGLVAREVALWVGAAISARGRRIKAKNAEARARFDREQAEHRAEIERTGAVVRPA